MAFFDKLKGIAKDVSKTAAAVAKSAARDLSKLGGSAVSAEEQQAQAERMEAIRKASEEHRARVEQQQREAEEAQARAEAQAEAERKEKLAQRKEQRKQYIPTIPADACDFSHEALLYPESTEYALRLHALKNEFPGSECDSYEEITSEFLESFLPAYADAVSSFTYYVRKYGIGESNAKLRLFHLLPDRPATMTQQHINVMMNYMVDPPDDPEEAKYYFENLAAVLQKKRTYDRPSSDMSGVMFVAGIYYRRSLRERLFKRGDYCSAKEDDLFNEYGQLKPTGNEYFAHIDNTNNLYDMLEFWIDCSPQLKGQFCNECGACKHWKGKREDWKALHAVEVEPDTNGVCTLFTIPGEAEPTITVSEDTCTHFEPCTACKT